MKVICRRCGALCERGKYGEVCGACVARQQSAALRAIKAVSPKRKPDESPEDIERSVLAHVLCDEEGVFEGDDLDE